MTFKVLLYNNYKGELKMIKKLLTIGICGNECRMFKDDGMFINWTEIKPISELPALITKANEEADEKTLKTIITVDDLENVQQTALSIALDTFDIQYLIGEGDIPLTDRRPKLQEQIAKLKAGLF